MAYLDAIDLPAERYSRARKVFALVLAVIGEQAMCFLSGWRDENGDYQAGSLYFFTDSTIALVPLDDSPLSVTVLAYQGLVRKLGVYPDGYEYGRHDWSSRQAQLRVEANIAPDVQLDLRADYANREYLERIVADFLLPNCRNRAAE